MLRLGSSNNYRARARQKTKTGARARLELVHLEFELGSSSIELDSKTKLVRAFFELDLSGRSRRFERWKAKRETEAGGGRQRAGSREDSRGRGRRPGVDKAEARVRESAGPAISFFRCF